MRIEYPTGLWGPETVSTGQITPYSMLSAMVGELFQNSTKNIYSTSTTVFTFKQNIHPTSTIIFTFKKNTYSTSTIVFTFKKNIHSTSSINNWIYFQEKYLFNFNDRFLFNFKL